MNISQVISCNRKTIYFVFECETIAERNYLVAVSNKVNYIERIDDMIFSIIVYAVENHEENILFELLDMYKRKKINTYFYDQIRFISFKPENPELINPKTGG